MHRKRVSSWRGILRGFVIAAFAAAFVFGYVLVGPDEHRVARAIGVAIALSVLGGLVARRTSLRGGAIAVSTLAFLMWMGR
jgi:hypothetical protein